ncbi:MAG: helix-turn-helix domain-containing protein [Hydrogenophaga sp.]|jgi:DNA-binding HxlR family transcriptional regulator|uniref:winged helix-turn-helix transcriptional regulator n=1 Tax=Hydrogenophaga sp. TaxID=1904254 RepID=UPI002717AEB5|nr:helix-turn-helix domain-containing protein [Hydrogenophaga sp.]MDO9572167.1 helix-turn-helix domain-containing protein [Hydrogenophaga sp.]
MNANEPPLNTEAPALATLMERGELFAAACPSRAVLQHVTSRWGVLVLVALLAGTHRFSDLRRKIGGVSEKMLAQTLQWLEGDGFVLRTQYPVVPPHVEYSLTPMGVEVARQVEGLADWIEVNLARILSGRRERADALAADQPRPGVRHGVRTLA